MKPGMFKERVEETYGEPLKVESRPSWITNNEGAA